MRTLHTYEMLVAIAIACSAFLASADVGANNIIYDDGSAIELISPYGVRIKPSASTTNAPGQMVVTRDEIGGFDTNAIEALEFAISNLYEFAGAATDAVNSNAAGIVSLRSELRDIAWLGNGVAGEFEYVKFGNSYTRAIGFNGREYIAALADGTFFNTANPLGEWERTPGLALPKGQYARRIRYAHGKWLAAVREGGVYVTEAIGDDWTKIESLGDVDCTDADYDYKTKTWFVATYGGLYTSSNGTDWAQSMDGAWRSVRAADGKAVAGSAEDGGLAVWDNGAWYGTSVASNEFRAIGYDGKCWVAASYAGIKTNEQWDVENGHGIYCSDDGYNWDFVYPSRPNIYSFASAGGLLTAARIYSGTNEAVLCSIDGRNWRPMPNAIHGPGFLCVLNREGNLIAGSTQNRGVYVAKTSRRFFSNFIYSKAEIDEKISNWQTKILASASQELAAGRRNMIVVKNNTTLSMPPLDDFETSVRVLYLAGRLHWSFTGFTVYTNDSPNFFAPMKMGDMAVFHLTKSAFGGLDVERRPLCLTNAGLGADWKDMTVFRDAVNAIEVRTYEHNTTVAIYGNLKSSSTVAYINWGDGSPLAEITAEQFPKTGTGSVLTHKYVRKGRFVVLVSDDIAKLGTTYDTGANMNGRWCGLHSFLGTELLESSFAQQTNCASAYMPNVVKIGQAAFVGSALEGDIECPVCEEIGNYAFAATSIGKVKIPNAQSIGDGAFMGCTNLVYAEPMPECTTLGGGAFLGCAFLPYLKLGTLSNVASNDVFMGFADCTEFDWRGTQGIVEVGNTCASLRNMARFPWGASTNTLFRCSDGYIRFFNGQWGVVQEDTTVWAIQVPSANYEVELGTIHYQAGVTSATIDWGDGTTSTVSTPTITHTYSAPGGYNIVLPAGIDIDLDE